MLALVPTLLRPGGTARAPALQMRERDARWPWLEWKGPPTWQEETGYRSSSNAEPRWLSWLDGGRGREGRDEREWADEGDIPPPWEERDDERRWGTSRGRDARTAATARLESKAGSFYTPPGSGGTMSDAEAKSRWYAERDAQQRREGRPEAMGPYDMPVSAAKTILNRQDRHRGSAVANMAGVGNVVSPEYAAMYERYAEKDAKQRWADRRRPTGYYDPSDRAAKTVRGAAFSRTTDVPVAAMASSRNVSPEYAARYGRINERDWQQRFADRGQSRDYDPNERAGKMARDAGYARYSDGPVASMASNVSPKYADRYGGWGERDWQQRLADRGRDPYDRGPYEPSERAAKVTRDAYLARGANGVNGPSVAGMTDYASSPSYEAHYKRYGERSAKERWADPRQPTSPFREEMEEECEVMSVEATAPGGEMMEVDVSGEIMAVLVPDGIRVGEPFTFQTPTRGRRSGAEPRDYGYPPPRNTMPRDYAYPPPLGQPPMPPSPRPVSYAGERL